jgi:hypothetical protein
MYYQTKVIIIFYFFGINRSCPCQSFNDDGTVVGMSLLPVSIESVSSPAMGSLHYANIHDGRQTRLSGSVICCFPTATAARELDAMEWFIRFTGSTYPPTNTPLQQQQQPPVVFVFTDGLSYLMISKVSFLSSLFYININWNKTKK